MAFSAVGQTIDPVERLRDQGVVVARSAGAYPTERIVTFVADNSATLPAAAPTSRLSLGERIEEACGSVQPGYLAAVGRKNEKLSRISLDMPARGVVLPACLYATRTNIEIRAQQGDSQTSISERFTGYGRFDPRRLRELFGSVTEWIKLDKPVGLKLITAPTFVKPTIGTAEYMNTLATLGMVDVATPEPGGKIIGPTDKACSKGAAPAAVAAGRTELRAAYPFHPAAVLAAFKRTLAGGHPHPTRVALVDNGFWGVPSCSGPDCPERDASGALEFADPFPRPFFETDAFDGDIGPRLVDQIAPINYANKLGAAPVDPIRGHGTHVAGLILGGPTMVSSRNALFGLPGTSWLTISISNLAPGGLTFPRDADERLFLLLTRTRSAARPGIVNLSLAMASDRSDFLRLMIGDPMWRDTLFVGAAGNDQENIDTELSYPAALGGGTTANVVTVASIDGNGALSEFTGYGMGRVDLAAPGCAISSWLTLEGTPTEVSGSSQATSLVAFASALLRGLWPDATPAQVKARLAYSGALLETAGDRDRIWSGTRLDLFQALLLRDDIVVARNPDRILLGKARKLEGFACKGASTPGWTQVRAFKTGAEGRLYISADSRLSWCAATLAPKIGEADNALFVDMRATYADGVFEPANGLTTIPAADLVELVRGELPN